MSKLVRSSLRLLCPRRSAASSAPSAVVPKYTKLSEGTPDEFRYAQELFAKLASPSATADRMLRMVEDLKGMNIGAPVDLFEHSVQSATRALRDGAGEEKAVCALMHDVGELLVPACHGEVAGSLLRPYISPENYWILNHHEIFQAYYYGEAMRVDKDLRERFRDHDHFGACEEFCGRWDETAFDPNYDSLPLSEFRPMLIRLLERRPYAQPSQLTSCATSKAKADLGAYDFDDWMGKNKD